MSALPLISTPGPAPPRHAPDRWPKHGPAVHPPPPNRPCRSNRSPPRETRVFQVHGGDDHAAITDTIPANFTRRAAAHQGHTRQGGFAGGTGHPAAPGAPRRQTPRPIGAQWPSTRPRPAWRAGQAIRLGPASCSGSSFARTVPLFSLSSWKRALMRSTSSRWSRNTCTHTGSKWLPLFSFKRPRRGPLPRPPCRAASRSGHQTHRPQPQCAPPGDGFAHQPLG